MLPPTIPTSFVPHPGSGAPRRVSGNVFGLFSFISYGALALAFFMAVGMFFYGRILAGIEAGKQEELAQAERDIDLATVEGFVRLQNRLRSGQELLDGHLAFSNFFKTLETLMPASVRFTGLNLTAPSTGTIKLMATGTARSFNALAAASAALANDGRIKDAIFSDITVNREDSSVSFTFTATLDPKIVAFTP